MSITLLSISLYMMITTRYTHALGDYVLELIGLKSWTGEYRGVHLTIFYFSILVILGLYLVRKYAIDGLGIRTRNVIFLVIAFITIFSLITNAAVISIKRHSNGLLSVGYNSKNSKMDYKSEAMKYIEFNAEIQVKNYASKSKEFYLTIDSPFYRKEGIEHIDIFTKSGNKAIFRLNAGETKTFKVNLDEYMIKGGRLSLNGSGSGIIDEIILTDMQGNAIRLDDDNFFGIEISR